MITIEQYKGVNVLRDDLLKGGTKSILMPSIIGDDLEYVYASPVYGGFQIALSAYCQSVNKKATIFCAKRKEMHPNTLKCQMKGYKIYYVSRLCLSVRSIAHNDRVLPMVAQLKTKIQITNKT